MMRKKTQQQLQYIQLAFQNEEKKKNAEELTVVNNQLSLQNDEKEKTQQS
jgi:hypothetical protein